MRRITKINLPRNIESSIKTEQTVKQTQKASRLTLPVPKQSIAVAKTETESLLKKQLKVTSRQH